MILCNKRLNWNWLLSSLLCLSIPAFASGGKIAGKVSDKQTGEPMPGVNIVVEGTTLGAATNVQGEYVILNVPSGKYTLRASFIGYAATRVENLRVSVDLTTRHDFALAPETITGEEVVIVAERPLVQKDLTATQQIKTAEEIKALPVETFLGVLTTQAGVNTGADGTIHIRGGRSNEIGYYIDGVPVANPFFTNSLANNVSNQALEELKVISGAFNAEYGNAMSGIVNLQIKEGGSQYRGSFSVYTGDYLSNDKDIFFSIDDLDPLANYVFDATLNGPVPFLNNKLTFNLSSRYEDNEGFRFGVREHLPSDSANFENDNNWYIERGGDGAYVPMNPRRDLNFLGKLTYRLTNKIKLSAQALYDRGRYKLYNVDTHPYRYNPDGTQNYREDSYNYSFKLSQAFTKSFYEANFFYAITDYKQAVYDSPTDPRYVPTTRIQGSPTTATFEFGGTQMGYIKRDSDSYGGKIDFTSQFNARHELKTGANFRSDHLRERTIIVLYDNDFYRQPTVAPENETPSHTFYDKTATFFSVYLQDKIEYDNMIINAGVRYDYFDPNSDYISNILDPEGARSAAEPKHSVSPRLGVAFPITDRGILHFSYGHFYQMPELRRIYGSNVYGASGFSDFGYANLRPEKTVNYEFGLQQQLGEALALEMSLFSKDIRDLLALQEINYQSLQFGPQSYKIYLNKDYGAVRGITLSLTKRHDPSTKLSAWIDYTFQKAEGNDVRDDAFFFSALSGREEEKAVVPLDWDQRHILNTTVTISEPNNWGFSFIGKISSGWPHTPDIPYANYVPDANSGNKPWQQNLDMRVFKNLRMNRIDFVLFAKVFNVFDVSNERFVFDDTGRSGYTFVNRSLEETEAFTRHYGEPGVHTWSEYQVRPNYYGAPRSVQVGVSLEF
ncbi:MAG: TonB-dependent receptor [bacterium]